MITNTTLDDFYKRNGASLPDRIAREIGHFNVFESEKLFNKADGTRTMPYSRRAYYKISWLRGNSRAEYADKVVDVQGNALLFATPKIPYNWVPESSDQTGMFCIFTADFFWPGKSGVFPAIDQRGVDAAAKDEESQGEQNPGGWLATAR